MTHAADYTRLVGQSELHAQALRINARYVTEIVEAFDLCPWASSVREGAGLTRRVLLASNDTLAVRAETLACIEEVAGDLKTDIGLLIFPALDVSPKEFRALVAAMESGHAQAYARGEVPLAMADFHPKAALDLSSPARLVSFIRRAPDPTIQLVRRSAMARVRNREDEGSMFAESLAAFMPLMGTAPRASVSDNIARNNLRTIERVGPATIEAILSDIADDRERAYVQARSLDAGQR